MGFLLIIIAINTKRDWLRNVCFSIAGLVSILAVIGSAEMAHVVALREFIGWCLGFVIGYTIRHYRQRGKKTSIEKEQSYFSSMRSKNKKKIRKSYSMIGNLIRLVWKYPMEARILLGFALGLILAIFVATLETNPFDYDTAGIGYVSIIVFGGFIGFVWAILHRKL